MCVLNGLCVMALLFLQVDDAQNRGPQSLKAFRCVAADPQQNLLIVAFRLFDGAECQHYAEKQHLPLALNQL